MSNPRVISPSWTDLDKLARTVWGEARGEGRIGMEAVAAVIGNRLLDSRWPATWSAVCLQPKQFSCWNQADPNLQKLLSVQLGDPFYRLAVAVAAEAIAGEAEDRTCGANHYLASRLFDGPGTPLWAEASKVTCRIGRHVFLKL